MIVSYYITLYGFSDTRIQLDDGQVRNDRNKQLLHYV